MAIDYDDMMQSGATGLGARYDEKDVMLYALGVGAGTEELPFVTENSIDVTQQVLPTMAVVLMSMGGGGMANLGDINWAMLVHGEQGVRLHQPIPVSGTVSTPNPCHVLSGAAAREGSTITLTVTARSNAEMCIQSIGSLGFDATLRAVPAGSYTLRVVHTYPGSGWETKTAMTQQVQVR